MRSWIPKPLIGVINFVFFFLTTFVLSSFLFILLLIAFILPKKTCFHKGVMHVANNIPRYWGSSSTQFHRLITGMTIDVRGTDHLDQNTWYLLLSNHRSWADIYLLHFAFDERVPPLRFFVKQELFWIPLIGLVCKGLGYPFMRRYTKEQVAKNPSLKGRDIKETRKACERFKSMPITIINFVEGTRYTKSKAARQRSPYQHLLKPRAGGAALTLAAMSDQLQKMIRVGIVYDNGRSPTFWQYLCGNIHRVIIDFHTTDIPPEMIGDYTNDRAFRIRFQAWLNEQWQQKDERLTQLGQESAAHE
jgi:1-acyl-sn-glycerol-3-phosphate acyltransferase